MIASPAPGTTGFEIVTLRSGVKSLRGLHNREIFHPGIGPVAEARLLHVCQQQIEERTSRPGKFVIWDVGLGAAANAVTALGSLSHPVSDVEIHSFDQTIEPLQFALNHGQDLEYIEPHRIALHDLIQNHQAQVSPKVLWKLHLGDFRQQMLQPSLPSPHAIFYDPYSVVSNREMWTLDHFTRLRQRLDDATPCLMTSYSRSTITRVTWLLAGFFVGIGCTIGEKEETTLVSNCQDLIKQPLNKKWLERVKISHSSAPIRGNEHTIQPISPEDFEALKKHSQF